MIIETIRTTRQFQDLHDEWNHLLEKSTSNNLCLTWEWIYTWWKHYRKGKSLFIIKVSDDKGRLIGLAPLCITDDHVYHIATIKVLSFLGSGEVCSDYMDFIICRDQQDEILKKILEHIHSHSELWHFVVLNDIPESSSNYKVIIETMRSWNTNCLINDASTCPYIKLPQSYESYTQSLSKNMRYNLRRKTRAIEQKYKAEFSVSNRSDNIEEAMEHLINLHKKRRAMLGDKGNFIRDSMLAFHKEIAVLFNKKGLLRIYTLNIKDAPVAVIYGFSYCGRFYNYQTGMDPAYEKQSVGTVLVGLCIRDSIENGLEEFDFMRGAEPYKFRWTKTSIKTNNIILTSSESHRGQSYVAAKSLYRRIKCLAKKDFPLKGLKQKDD